MNRILLRGPILVLILACYITVAWSAASLDIQATVMDGTAGTASPVFSPTSFTAADLLVVLVASNNNNAGGILSSVTDDQSGVWSNAQGCELGSGVPNEIWYAPNATGGTTNVTLHKATGTNGNTLRSSLTGWKGMLTVHPFEQTAACANGAGTQPASKTLTPFQTNELVISVCNDNQVTTTSTVGAPFTVLNQDTNKVILPAYVIQTTIAAAQASWTLNPVPNFWDCSIASFLSTVSAETCFSLLTLGAC